MRTTKCFKVTAAAGGVGLVLLLTAACGGVVDGEKSSSTAPTIAGNVIDRAPSVSDWIVDNSTYLDQISDVLGRLYDATTDEDYGRTGVLCSELSDLVGRAQRVGLPEPAVMGGHYARALDHLDQAADACIGAVTTFDDALFAEAGDHFTQASEEIAATTRRLEEASDG